MLAAARKALLAIPRMECIGTATSTTSTITMPPAGKLRDLAVLFQYAQNSSGSPTAVTPAGFGNQNNNVGVTTTIRAMCDSKVLVDGDAGAVLTGMNGTSANEKILGVFRRWPVFSGPGALGQTNASIGASFPDTAPGQSVVSLNQLLPNFVGQELALVVLCFGATTAPLINDVGMPITGFLKGTKLQMFWFAPPLGQIPNNVILNQGDGGNGNWWSMYQAALPLWFPG